MTIDNLARKIIGTIVDSRSSQTKEAIGLTLYGSKAKRIIGSRLNELSSYGAFLSEEITYAETGQLIDYLIEQGLIYENNKYQATYLAISRAGIAFLTDQSQSLGLNQVPQRMEAVESETVIALKALRKMLAEEAKVSPFIIFDNKILKQLAQKKPVTKEAFLEINGLGLMKWEQFGERVIQLIDQGESR